MARKSIRILCVHGLGDHRTSAWRDSWETAIRSCFASEAEVDLVFRFSTYDPIFEQTNLSFAETIGALFKLAASGVGQVGRRHKGVISDIADRLRWTAGYVVAWVEDDAFQKATRDFILNEVREFAPDVVLAHSLGSLVTYNAFSHPDAADAATLKLLKKVHYVTFGSQIGNPFVVGNLTHGRVQLPPVRHWHHLFNKHDKVFTAELKLQGVPNFSQLLTTFDEDDDHSPTSYLTHSATVNSFWHPLAALTADAKAFGGVADPWRRAAPTRATRSGRRRALLVGINEYPRESDRLAGCVNDVFTMSAVLQECGFAPEEIRTCLDDRATAEGILSRMEWLVDGVQPGDERVFYYSGHGARLPEYGENFEPDRLTETLVPWDFDWTPETCVSDEQIFALYSQLPYDAQLMLIFDCCHSGSMHRQSGAKARGISPPDDIRHRELKWDLRTGMWVDRDFTRLNDSFSSRSKDNAAFFGGNGVTVKLGRAPLLRLDSKAEYEKARSEAKAPIGPYLPLIIEACGEDQLSYEYRHGATSYGAFTFCLASILREQKAITFERLVEKTRDRLKDLKYDQTPQILGPTVVMKSQVPWTGGRKGEPASEGVPGGLTPRTSG